MIDVPRLEDLGDLSGKSVLVRADFNVPISEGHITDDLRIRAAVPTLRYLLEAGASVTACTHLGRPKGESDAAYSVDPVRARLAEWLPEVTLLDNLRFDPGETANDPTFVQALIEGHDAYVNDAFGASHRGPPAGSPISRRPSPAPRGRSTRRDERPSAPAVRSGHGRVEGQRQACGHRGPA